MLLNFPHTANILAPNIVRRAEGNIQVYGINQEPKRLGAAAVWSINVPQTGGIGGEPWLKKREMKLGLYNRIRCIGDKKLDL